MHAVVRTPAARADDPHSSHAAAEELTLSSARGRQQVLAAEAVKQYPGLTSLEVAQRARMDRYMLARRLPECIEAGTVRKGQERRCSVSGRLAITWWPPGVEEQLVLFTTLPAAEAAHVRA